MGGKLYAQALSAGFHVGSFTTVVQLGSFAGMRGRESVEVTWGFISLLSVTALFVTSLLAHLERTEVARGMTLEHFHK